MPEFRVQNFRADMRNTRQGYCEIVFPKIGLVIRKVAVHRFEKDGHQRWWMAMPAESYDGADGKKKFFAFLVFDEWANKEIQQEAVEQLKVLAPEIFGNQGEEKTPSRPRRATHSQVFDAQRPLGPRPADPAPFNDDLPF